MFEACQLEGMFVKDYEDYIAENYINLLSDPVSDGTCCLSIR